MSSAVWFGSTHLVERGFFKIGPRKIWHTSHLDPKRKSRMEFTYFWFLATTLMLIHQHQVSTVPVSGPMAEEGPLVQLPHTAHRREKRCSCENQKDKECIFFCHIGIVWVNTPSQVVPYGFGSVRLRRELGRCSCTNTQDAECVSFCSAHSQTRVDDALATRKSSKQLRRNSDALWEKRSRHALNQQT